MSKVCSICKKNKSLDEFHVFNHSSGKQYYLSQCKNCSRNRKRQVYPAQRRGRYNTINPFLPPGQTPADLDPVFESVLE